MTLTTALTLICILLALIAWRQILAVVGMTVVAIVGCLVLMALGAAELARVALRRR